MEMDYTATMTRTPDYVIFRDTKHERLPFGPYNGVWKWRLMNRDASEASCGENRPDYKFVRYLEFDEAREMILNGEASNHTGMLFSKPRIRVKAGSKKV
jgi:hypothetical protein